MNACKTKKVNSTVAQLKFLLDKNMINKKYNVEWIFGQTKNLDDKVVSTRYLNLHHEEWIGYTALHFAASDRESDALNILLDHAANFKIKNAGNSTALHQIIEDDDSISDESVLDDTIVNSILSAHVKYNNFENPSNENGLSHFHIACAANNAELVQGFLHSGVVIDLAVNADYSTFPGFTPLHFAAKYCASEVAEKLLSNGANLHIRNANGMTPLHVALSTNFKITFEEKFDEVLRERSDKTMNLFLKKECDDNMMVANSYGLSHLHVACTLKDSKIAEYLLQNVVNINQAINSDSPVWPGYTPLHFAALCNNMDTVKLLMNKGADINIKNGHGVTPLDIFNERYEVEDVYAIISRHSVYKNILLSDGTTKLIDLVSAMRSSKKFKSSLRKFSKSFNTCDSLLWPGCSPMHLAVIFSKNIFKSSENKDEDVQLEIIKKLLKRNPGMLHSQDMHGYTPLHLAFRLNKKAVLEMFLNVLELNSNVVDYVDEDGLSYLHIASAKNKTNMLRRLLSTGTNVNAAYKGKSLTSHVIYPGWTSLHLAVINGSTEALEALIKHGADVYAKDENDLTPVHFLLESANGKLADILFAYPNLKDSVVREIGLSHLHVASVWGRPEHVESLLDNGADIDGAVIYSPDAKREFDHLFFLKRYAGHSPLALAYRQDRFDIAKTLLERGADVFVADVDGKALFYEVLEDNFVMFFDTFVDFVRASDALKARLKDGTGMTELHLACLDMESVDAAVDVIETLISEGANVNAQIRADSPVFQGYTPLHIAMHFIINHLDIIDQVIELFLKAGADVTQEAGQTGTVVHMTWASCSPATEDAGDPEYNRVNTLLKAQRDFSVNPVDVGGVTHFHIACYVCNTSIVEKFLRHGDVDIDQATDFFHDDVPGHTALHLAIMNNSVSRTKVDLKDQLDTIDLLLEHGADVHVKDAYGFASLHKSAYLKSLDVFERLVRSGADVNARHSCGGTPLSCFLESTNVSAEKIKILLRYGCHVNAFNPVTDEGYIGVTFCKLPYQDMRNLLSAINVNFKQEMETDHLGRTTIHNIVSVDSPFISAKEYAYLIDKLSRTGCDVDNQDHLGRTALHVATKFYNFKGISGLLMVGADINITDFNGETAFAYINDRCVLCETYEKNTDGSAGEKCKHIWTLEALAIQVKKLQLRGLDVNRKNMELASKAFENFGNRITLSGKFFKALESMKITTIGSHSLTLNEFLSENGAVAVYPTMSEVKRDDMNNFFSPSEFKSVRARFPEVAGILQLQYRKARSRPQLVELAKNSMALLIGFRLPEICSHFIMVLLTNSELKNLIASTIE